MSWTRVLEALLLPPASLIWCMGAGLLLSRFRRRAGRLLVAGSLGMFYLLSTPWIGGSLVGSLDRYLPIDLDVPLAQRACDPQAVVVLGAGRRSGAREYASWPAGELNDGEEVSAMGLERLLFGVRLSRRWSLPMLVTGTSAGPMARALETMGARARWIDTEGHNTHLNAVGAAALLNGAEVRCILLVTHFWHMPRAVAAFEGQGLEALAAPMGFAGGQRRGPLLLLPQLPSAMSSQAALHEWLGRIWYHLRYGYALITEGSSGSGS